MHKTLIAALIGAVTLVTASPVLGQCDADEVVIKFSHVTNADRHPKGIAASLLEQRVNTEMNGIACMQVFPNSSLLDDNKVLEALLIGDVHLAAPSLSKFEKFTKKFRIFDLPFLFDNVDAVDRFQKSSAGRKLMNSMQRRGLHGLAFWHNGMKQMSANRPLLTPDDVEGLRMRVQTSDVLVAQFKQLGTSPQKMAFSEVYGALQTGVIDGQENTWSNIYGKKFFEVQDGITETNHGIIDYLVVTSTEWWASQQPTLRDQFLKILKEVTETRNEESVRVNEVSKVKIMEAGGEIRTLTPEQRTAWVKALKPIWLMFEDDIGSELLKSALQGSGRP